jgi:hypothetical protein
MAVSSLVHCDNALSLQTAYNDYQIGAFENFHQHTLTVLRPGPKVFRVWVALPYRLKSQLLISHLFLPIKQMPPGKREETRNQAAFRRYPLFFELSDQFLFQCGTPQRTIATAFLVRHRFRGRLTKYSRQ